MNFAKPTQLICCLLTFIALQLPWASLHAHETFRAESHGFKTGLPPIRHLVSCGTTFLLNPFSSPSIAKLTIGDTMGLRQYLGFQVEAWFYEPTNLSLDKPVAIVKGTIFEVRERPGNPVVEIAFIPQFREGEPSIWMDHQSVHRGNSAHYYTQRIDLEDSHLNLFVFRSLVDPGSFNLTSLRSPVRLRIPDEAGQTSLINEFYPSVDIANPLDALLDRMHYSRDHGGIADVHSGFRDWSSLGASQSPTSAQTNISKLRKREILPDQAETDGGPSDQGWKIHVASYPSQAFALANLLLPILQENKIEHKVDSRIIVNPESMGEGQFGKFIVIYTKSPAEAKNIAAILDNAIKQRGPVASRSYPVIPHELAIGVSGALYTRYAHYDDGILIRPDGTPDRTRTRGRMIAPSWVDLSIWDDLKK